MKERERKLEQGNEEGTEAIFITGKHGKFYGPAGFQLLSAPNFGKVNLETVKG
jgi:hypothetical protein